MGRVVALKMVRGQELGPDEGQRFRHEARVVAGLDHPHIVPVYEVGEEAGRLFFSMKLMDGGSLAAPPGRFVADPRSAARTVALVARAVYYAHQRGILHRDLKPANILLDQGTRSQGARVRPRVCRPVGTCAVHPDCPGVITITPG